MTIPPTPWRPYPTGPRGPWCVADADGGTVCAVHGSEGEPIARLLALAPQMLAALRGITADVQSREDFPDLIGTVISGDHWARAVDAVTRMAAERATEERS